jgi:hypothetical protein
MPKIVAEYIELKTQDENKVLNMSQIEKFADGSGYRCELSVASRGFSCHCPFYFDGPFLSDAVTALQRMDDGKPGEATIRGLWEEAYIKFASDQLGHVVVSGELFEHSEFPQAFRFAFRTDQTVLSPMISDLARVLQA